MEIDKNSWHFRLLDKMDFRVTGDINYGTMTLCEYTWSVIGALTLALSIFLVMGLTFYGGYIWMFAMPTEDNPANILQGLAMLVSGTLGVVVGLFCAAGGVVSIIKLFPKKENPEPNVFVEYIKAKKQKFCPIVTLKKEVKSD